MPIPVIMAVGVIIFGLLRLLDHFKNHNDFVNQIDKSPFNFNKGKTLYLSSVSEPRRIGSNEPFNYNVKY